ncbi:MAG: serine/threonine-protein kinase [Planctomycetota bacterium]|nr:serine/threonine-protein kinase [Planctomycetota bacterium]
MDWEAFYNAFRRPDFIPGYEIENRLGGGAFGDVYRARKSSIGKPYAIKFLKVGSDDQQEAVERELDQVRHFAAIDHPNLVTIEDLGVVMDVPYLIMGYAGEETLAKRFKRGDLAPEEALRVFVQAARGVLALHERSIVHFDLKPSNVFLRGESARVGDYGLSKLLDSGRMTLSFGRGTPMYMAPEMLKSRADHRADIYSLGVILFEALTGRLPFRPDEHGGLVLRETDEPPEFPDGFPAVARPAVEGCLRLDPDDRFGTVAELLDALGQTARPGDSVVFALAPHERARLAAEPTRPAERPSAPASSAILAGGYTVQGGEGEDSTEIDPESPAGRARLLVRELRAKAEAAAAEDGPRPASISVIPVPPRVTGGLGSTMLETIRVGFDVFLAVILAVTGALVGGFRYVTDHLVRSQRGGVMARALRFAVFLLIMVGVGFGATLVGMFGLFVLEQAGGA